MIGFAIDRDAMEAIAVEIATAVRVTVAPYLGRSSARVAVGSAPGGDTTLAIDDAAEEAVAAVIEAHGNLAYYSEDRGFVSSGRPRAIFVIDPVDGTRPAAAGFEACCVSVAVLVPDRDATLGQVEIGVIDELVSGRSFRARRDEGVQITSADGTPQSVSRSRNTDLASLYVGASNRARPLVPLAYVLGELIDGAAMGGGYFELGSATFAMTRIVTGQLDAYVDPAQRMIDEFAALPALAAGFRAAGRGSIATNFPYDIAAATLIVSEGGGLVTDAAGRSFDDVGAVGSGSGYGVSVVAAASAELHSRVVAAMDRGIERLGAALRHSDLA